MAQESVPRWHRLSLFALVFALVFSAFAFVGPSSPANGVLASGEYTAQAVTYEYSFLGVDGAAVRGKAQWGNSDQVDCTGGVTLPGGKVIVASSVDIRGRLFRFWFYPPGTDSTIQIVYANVRVENAPPGGWGDTGTFNPTRVCALFHQNNDGSYRLKAMFTSFNGDGRGWALALLDTGINLVITEVQP